MFDVIMSVIILLVVGFFWFLQEGDFGVYRRRNKEPEIIREKPQFTREQLLKMNFSDFAHYADYNEIALIREYHEISEKLAKRAKTARDFQILLERRFDFLNRCPKRLVPKVAHAILEYLSDRSPLDSAIYPENTNNINIILKKAVQELIWDFERYKSSVCYISHGHVKCIDKKSFGNPRYTPEWWWMYFSAFPDNSLMTFLE